MKNKIIISGILIGLTLMVSGCGEKTTSTVTEKSTVANTKAVVQETTLSTESIKQTTGEATTESKIIQTTEQTIVETTTEQQISEFSFSSEQIRYIANSLNVPTSIKVTAEYERPKYWDAGEQYLVYVQIKDESGEVIASASVNPDTLQIVKDIYTYSK